MGLLGDQHLSTMTASFAIQGVNGDFTYWGEGTASNPCGTPGTVRLAFESIAPGTKFAYTNYWWSNPMSVPLANVADGTMSVTLSDPSLWSDWNGTNGRDVPDAFTAAASNMTVVGLSFGGGCFFENGVGTTDGSGSFTLTAFTS